MKSDMGVSLRRGGSAAVCVLAALLALSGCTASDGGAVVDPAVLDPAVHGTEWQAEHFPGAYEQEIDWFECGEDEGLDDGLAEALASTGVDIDGIGCAMISAPFDWDDPENPDTIDLAIVHIPSTGDQEATGTLLGNPGGPGVAGLDFMLGMPTSPGFEEVMEQYDLLGFDPRGIGGSTPIDCDGAGSELRTVQLGECIAENPLTHTMGTVQVARDMDLLRSLMGEDKLDYLGYSYGTMLGATYASIFPDQAGRMVLDSAENAEWASPIHTYDQQVAISNALVALATSCRTDFDDEVKVCPFDSEASLLSVLEKLNNEPLVASSGIEIAGDHLHGYLTQALYESHYQRGQTLDRIALALFGNQEAIDEIGADFSGDDYGVDLGMDIVTCHSFPIEPNIPGLLAHIDEAGVPRLLGGPEVSDEVLAPFVDLSCYALPESGLDYTDSFKAPTAGKILVIGITGDHATPFQYAQVLADELGNATLLTLDGQGHAASYTGRSSCIDAAVTDYLVRGVVPEKGAVCFDD